MPRNAISASTLVGVALWMLLPAAAPAQEPVDWVMVNKIRDEGLHRSQVMSILEHLADEIGPRLTGSPQMKEANEWTRQQLADWGLEDARLEGYEFGRGWSFSRASVHMLSPRQMPLLALPVAWTPGTGKKGVRGEAEKVEIESEKDFDKYRGKLAGKILFPAAVLRRRARRARGLRDPWRPPPELPRARAQALAFLQEAQRFPGRGEGPGEGRDQLPRRRPGAAGGRRLAGARRQPRHPVAGDGRRALQLDRASPRHRGGRGRRIEPPAGGARDRGGGPLSRPRHAGLQHRRRDPR
jgi:hypothetical protein